MVLFIGNINKQTTEKQLTELLSGYAAVNRLRILVDGVTRRSRGCAFADIEDTAAAQSVISLLHNTDFMGSVLVVNSATANQQKTLPWK